MFNPAIASEKIKKDMVSYISTKFNISDIELKNEFIDQLNEHITKGPIVEINSIFKSGKSLNELINEGIVSRLFRQIESEKSGVSPYDYKIPLDRALYSHQEKAIRLVKERKNLVISTGTGSGKTESFLLPIINDLLEEKENNTLNSGVRALLIYPMNALANDQLKRIREIFLYYPGITFGVYNGATDHSEKDELNSYLAMNAEEEIKELREPLANEILSRTAMQENPPHILFTNYAMLEHMLLRPNDGKVFSNSKFKFVVLDEAHVYLGATGMETAILIRRLKARIASKLKPQFILTSATLGSGEDGDSDVIKFAENLTGENFDGSSIIRGERIRFLTEGQPIEVDDNMITEMADDSKNMYTVLDKYKFNYDKNMDIKEIIYDIASNHVKFKRIMDVYNGPIDIVVLADKINVSTDFLISLLQIASKANKNNNNLINVRYHFFVRALEGAFLNFVQKPYIRLNRRESIFIGSSEHPVFEIATCSDCGGLAIIGQLDKVDRTLKRNVTKFDTNHEFYFINGNNDNDLYEEEESEIVTDKLLLCKKCGKTMFESEKHNSPCDCIQNSYMVLESGKNNSCPNCGVGRFHTFYLSSDVATSVLGTSLFDQLPEYIYEAPKLEEKRVTNSPFSIGSSGGKLRGKKSSKQFLVFSDSRQDAAYFASYMDYYYKSFIRRRGIFNLLNDQDLFAQSLDVIDFVDQLTNLFSNPDNKSFSESNFDNRNLTIISKKNAWIATLDEIANQNRSTSLVSLGYLTFRYKGNTPDLVNSLANYYNIDPTYIDSLLNQLFAFILRFGAIDTTRIKEFNDEDRKYVFYSAKQKYVVKNVENEEPNEVTYKFVPQIDQRINRFRKTYKLNIVKETLGFDGEDGDKLAANFLEMYWEYLINSEENKYALTSKNSNLYTVSASSIEIISNHIQKKTVFQCNMCKKVTVNNIHQKCSNKKCVGKLEEISYDELSDNHYINLYKSEKLTPFFIKEHTAQLSKRESLDYQKKFVNKEINALSCSTTFEMGVDVGTLETVFLRNVPPLPSNYTQRAGRAGRSKNAAAFSLTYAKMSSHDFNFFKNPLLMINGTIKPPIFSIENEKVILRHIYAVCLSYFFYIYPEMYHGNKIDNFIDNKGYLDFVDMLQSKPNQLKEILVKSIPSEVHKSLGIESFGWLDKLVGEEGILTLAVQDYESMIATYNKLINNYIRDKELPMANKMDYNKRQFMKKQLIDFLARISILPRYGFPVDTVELTQNQNIEKSKFKELNLSRDLQLAISEYAPGTQIVADGNLYTSRYIKQTTSREGKKSWDQGYIAVCDNDICNTINYRKEVSKYDRVMCVSCDKSIRQAQWSKSIEPRAGFISDTVVTPVGMTRPDKVYRTEEYYIGNRFSKQIDSYKFMFEEEFIIIETTANDSLLVQTLSDFYVCLKCGYSLGDNELPNKYQRIGKDVISIDSHRASYGSECSNNKLHKYKLHHIFNTDVAKITFSKKFESFQTGISTLYAFLDAISRVLNVERNDIKGTIQKVITSNGQIRWSLIVYDAVPGGVGHTRRLIENKGKILHQVINEALHNVSSCSCSPSCYNCLRNYQNQKIHNFLDRSLVENYLTDYATEITYVDENFKEQNYDETGVDLVLGESRVNDMDWDTLLNYFSEDAYNSAEKLREQAYPEPDNIFGDINYGGKIIGFDALWMDRKIIILSENNDDLATLINETTDWKVM